MKIDLIETIKLVGGLAGLIVFFWKILEEFVSYPKIKVSILKEEKKCTIGTEVENTNKFRYKTIRNAFILISKELEPIEITGKKVGKSLNIDKNLKSSYDFHLIKSDTPIYLEQSICLIPLDFYYRENPFICDERITYRASLELSSFEKGFYSVRFYIFGNKDYFRVTQELLQI